MLNKKEKKACHWKNSKSCKASKSYAQGGSYSKGRGEKSRFQQTSIAGTGRAEWEKNADVQQLKRQFKKAKGQLVPGALSEASFFFNKEVMEQRDRNN